MIGYYGLGYYASMIVLIPAIILTFYAQLKVKSAYAKYASIANSKGLTGRDVAEVILSRNGMADMPINLIAGNLTDHFNPANHTLNLSSGVFNGPTIAAIGIAAHECGHAIQDHEGYGLLRFRNKIVPVVNLGSSLSWPILILGLVLGATKLTDIGIILFLLVVLFHLVTLPVELDASRRALKLLEEYGLVGSTGEASGAKAVLSAAALTYVASLAMAIGNLLRMIMLTRNNRR